MQRLKAHPFRFVYALLPIVTLYSMLIFPGRNIVAVILALSTIAWWAVVVWYQTRSKWHLNPYGQNAMGVSFGLAILHTVFLLRFTVGLYPGYLIVDTMAFLNLGALAVQRIRFIEQAQRDSTLRK